MNKQVEILAVIVIVMFSVQKNICLAAPGEPDDHFPTYPEMKHEEFTNFYADAKTISNRTIYAEDITSVIKNQLPPGKITIKNSVVKGFIRLPVLGLRVSAD